MVECEVVVEVECEAVMLEAASQGYESSISDFIKILGNCYRRSSRSREK